MEAMELYRDIALRTQGEIYIGVVGPVRTGKSTFIKQFMQQLVIPNIENVHSRKRAMDELPQSGSGRMVMTTQPVFVPSEAVEIELPENGRIRLRMIDSVGYLVDGAAGTEDENGARMVVTPWSEEEMPFEQAAELGTQKVIGEHSTIGLVITTDGTVTDLPRSAYVPAEARIVEELHALGKPFAVVLNTQNPKAQKAQSLQRTLSQDYGVPVIAVNCEELDEADLQDVLRKVLSQFPVVRLTLGAPEWLSALAEDHWLVESLSQSIRDAAAGMLKLGDVQSFAQSVSQNAYVESVSERAADHGSGVVRMQLNLAEGLFNRVLAEQCGTEIKGDAHLLSLLRELVAAKREYDHVAEALESVRKTGYGLVPPKLEELTLQEPEIIKQGGKFGVKLRASAPSLHMMRVDIQTEVSPVVGTEQQSEEMIRYLMSEFEQDPQKLWQSNLFGKPLSDLVREGLAGKLLHMPEETQLKVQQTLGKIINEGSGTMICILL